MDRHIKQNLTGQSHSEWDMPSKPFLTIGEVANLLQVSNRTVYNLIYKGTLRACKITYHITLITKEDFFLMIKETTYCKRNTSIFAKQIKKNKEKMKADIQNTDRFLLFNKRERRKQRATQQNGSSYHRATTNNPCVTHSRKIKMSVETFIQWLRFAKSSIIPMGGFTTSVCVTLSLVAKPIQPSAFQKRKWTRLWQKKVNGWALI